MATFHERLKELRIQKGFSQQDLADRIDQTKQNVSQYERGVRRPNMDKLQELCDIFNVSMDYITGKEDVTPRLVDSEGIRAMEIINRDKEIEQIAKDIFEKQELRELFRAARECDPEDVLLAAKFLNRIKKPKPE